MTNKKIIAFITIVTALIFLTLSPWCFGVWDNNLPADTSDFDDAMGEIRDNWDALEVAFGVDLANASPFIDVTSSTYGVVADGSTDYITEIQAAADAAEDGTLYFPPDVNSYVINGTLYLGNVTVLAYGATLEIDNDATFSRLGTATRRTEGAIITKSAAGAGYSISSVELHIEGLTIYNNRTASTGTSIIGSFLLEQVSRGSIDHCRIYSDQAYNSVPLDFYANVKNFHVSNSEFSVDNTGNDGGVWVRNWDASNPTENINFNNCRFYTTGTDEILAIYNSSGVVSTIRNVNVNNCQFYANTGATLAHVISIYAANASGVVRNINISNFQIESAVNITTAISEGATGSGTVEHVNISNGSVRMKTDTTSSNTFGIRGVDSVSNVEIHVAALTNFTNNYTGFYDCGQITGCKLTFESGIDIKPTNNVYGAYSCDEIIGCDLYAWIDECGIVSNCALTDGVITNVKTLTYNDINISIDIGDTGLIVQDDDNGANYVIGNRITETFDSDTTDRIFAFDAYGPIFCNYNWYTGDRETWLTIAYNIASFKGNYMDSDGSGVIMGFPDGGYDMSDAATSGTGADTLKDTIIYADHLGTKSGIRIFAAGTKTASNGNKTIKMYFGTANWTFNAAANDTNDWRCEAIVVNTEAAKQRISWIGWNGTTITQGYETATEDTTSNVTVKVTGECAHASDTITQTMWLVEDL